MSKHKKYTPKHAAPRPARTTAARTAARSTMLASVAVTATGAAVGTGVVVSPVATVASLAAASGDEPVVSIAPAAGRETRAEGVSRTADRRSKADPAKRAALDATGGNAVSRSEDSSDADPRTIAQALLPSYGWADQFGCLDSLWVSESDWEVDADNPTSSAYGIPQALTELHDLPAGYMTDAEVQIRWGLDYIEDSYGSPCNAWSFKQGNNWY